MLAQLKGRTKIDVNSLVYYKARVLQAEGKGGEALEIFRELEKYAPPARRLLLFLHEGDILFDDGEFVAASEAYGKALELDGDNARAHMGLARCALRRRRNFEAASHALACLELMYANPQAHFVYGMALNRLGHPDWAVEAMETALKFAPDLVAVHRRLAVIYEKRLNDSAKAAEHRASADAIVARPKKAKSSAETPAKTEVPYATPAFPALVTGRAAVPPSEYIVVVTGLPRSGTSLAMQMLEAGGVLPLADSLRAADESNRRGYFEFEPVKRIAKDCSWLDLAKGKAVKIVVPLVEKLPSRYAYKVIFMVRDLNEVMRSQRHMLERLGRGAQEDSDGMSAYFEEQRSICRTMLDGLPHCDVLTLDYASAVADPARAAGLVAALLDNPALDVAAMTKAADPELYREHGSGAR